jgi:hypothetical protein
MSMREPIPSRPPATPNHSAWRLCGILAALLVAGLWILGREVTQHPYFVARYRGEGADLRGARLRHAQLGGAYLLCALLQRADLRGAHLRLADLAHTDLQRANLAGADLRSAEIICADLRNADLSHAALGGANLQDADLRGANLTGAQLTGSFDDYRTQWPRGFRPKQHSAVEYRIGRQANGQLLPSYRPPTPELPP